MSALPSSPLDYSLPEPPQPPRRRNWRKVATWIGAGLLILILLMVIAAYVLLHNVAFHGYMLREAQQSASAALGAPVQARDYALHFSGISPSVDLYDVVVAGAEPYANPPLLQVDHIRMGVRIVSLLNRKWYLNEVTVNHPVLRIFVDRNGTDNLPQTKRNGQSHTSVFDLGVRHALLDQGEVYYNNRKTVLNADLLDVNLQAAFDALQRQYSGSLSYREGHLQMENFNPMVHNLQAQFAAMPERFTLQRAVLTSGRSQFVLTATIEDYASPKVQAQYEALLAAGEFRRITKNESLPVGDVRLTGSMQYASEPTRPMLDTLILTGDLSSRALEVKTPSVRTEIRDIAAKYAVANGNLDVRDIRAQLLGGELTGTMTIRDLSGESRSRLKAALRGVSLADLNTMMSSPALNPNAPKSGAAGTRLQQAALRGTVNADTDATWGKTLDNLVARINATLQGSLGIPSAATTTGKPNAVPVNGVVHARYAAAAREISLEQSYLRTPQTSLSLNGTVSERSSLRVHMQSNNLHELETVANVLRTPVPGQQAQPLGLYGTASFEGAVRGSTSAPQLTGQLNAANLRVRESAWRVLRTNVSLSPSLLSLQNGELQPANRGRITFNLRTGLRHWSFTETSPIQVALNASQVNVSDLTRAAGMSSSVSGILSANVSVSGSELNPVGQGKISLTQAKIANEPIQSVNLNFQGTGNQVQADLAVHMAAGAAQASVIYFPKQRGYDAKLQANGIHLDQLHAVKARNLQLKGELNLNASGRGTVNNPALQASLQVPKIDIQGQTIRGINLQANVANHLAEVALNSEVVNTNVRGRGTVNLTGDYQANIALDTQSIPLQPLVAMYAPAQAADITGQTEIHGTLRGPLKNKSLLEAHITIPVLAVNYKKTVQIGAASPIHIDYSNGILELQRAAIRGTDTDLQLQGRVPMSGTAPASLLMLGSVNLRLLQLLDPDIASSGQMRFNINSYGQTANPDVHGQIQIINAILATGTVPIGLADGNGVLTLTKNRLEITQFRGTVGGGPVTVSGGIVYRSSLQFDLALVSKGARLLYPPGVREALNTNLSLTGTPQAAVLRGQVNINQLSFTPDFDLMNFIGQFSGETTPAPTQGFAQNLQLDIDVRSTGGVNLVSRTLSLQGTANLHAQGTALDPVILGRVNLTGGDLIFMGNRYVLQGGTIDFANPVQTQPILNVAADTTIQQYNLHLRFDGPIDHLRTSYAADPALPPSDIINLLAFGKTTEAAAANPAPGTLGAQSMIASEVSNQVTSRVQKIAGISQLSVDPVLGSTSGQNPGARVTIQQRVTSNLFVTFATDATSTQRQVIQVEYNLSPRTSVSATRDQNGGFGFDTRIRKTW